MDYLKCYCVHAGTETCRVGSFQGRGCRGSRPASPAAKIQKGVQSGGNHCRDSLGKAWSKDVSGDAQTPEIHGNPDKTGRGTQGEERFKSLCFREI